MNILFVTSEVAGFAKTGGLADVSAALPRYLHGAGHDVRVFMPYYDRVPGNLGAQEVVVRDMAIRLGGRGDITKTNVVWRVPTGGPYVSSLVHYQGVIYMSTDNGILSFDADGQGVGKAFVFAILSGAPTLAAADFSIVA